MTGKHILKRKEGRPEIETHIHVSLPQVNTRHDVCYNKDNDHGPSD